MSATLELVPVKRPWNKAQGIFIGVMTEYAKLPRGTCDIRWVHPGLRVSVAAPRGSSLLPTPIASFTIGTTWGLNREKFQTFALHVDAEVDDLRHKHHILHNYHCFYALHETDNWTTSAMNVHGHVVYGNDHGRTAILCPREVNHFRRSWTDHERCTVIMLGSAMLLSVCMPHSGRDEADYSEHCDY